MQNPYNLMKIEKEKLKKYLFSRMMLVKNLLT